jgi:hypothetical protein
MQSRVHGHDARGNGVTGVRISYAFRTFLIDLDMEVVGGYRYYTSEEQDKWCKEHGVPPVDWTLKQWRNPRTESGYPVLGPNYNKHF